MNLQMKNKAEGHSTKADQIEILSSVVANTFVIYMKTYAVHWNFHGSKFFSVHKLTEAQYAEQAEAVDVIAERIRALGGQAPVSLADIMEHTEIKELKSAKDQKQDHLIRDLVTSHERISALCKDAAEKLEDLGDKFSHDMLVQRIGAHDKAAWMLQSLVE